MPSSSSDLSRALDNVVSRFQALVLSVGARHALRGIDVDELFQDVRIRLWRGRTTSAEIEALPTSYVYHAAMSAAIDLMRKRRRDAARTTELSHVEIEAVPHRAAADERVALLELEASVNAALDRLLPPRRMVVRMSLAGYDRQQMVERLGWSDAKVRNLLSRGMDDLRTHLTHQPTDNTTGE